MSDAELTVYCALGCGETINPRDSSVRQRMVGWGHKNIRRASGAHAGSDIENREWLDEFAHAHCVKMAKNGINTQQTALI
jgi:hypothetical protein